MINSSFMKMSIKNYQKFGVLLRFAVDCGLVVCLKARQCYKFMLVSFSGIDLCVHSGQIEILQKPWENVHPLLFPF